LGLAIAAVEIVHYGAEPDQQAEYWPVPGDDGRRPVVALIHGGFWRERYRLELMHPLAADLVRRGYPVWNLEYRRLGSPGPAGGGWPGTFDDVAAGLAALTVRHPDRPVVVLGHSAGGHLALWAANRPVLRPALTVALAGVCDLVAAARLGLSGDAATLLLGGGPADVPERYALACPTLLLPARGRQLIVHGTHDDNVPFELGERYAVAAGAGCEFLPLPGVDHFALIDPSSDAWVQVIRRLEPSLS
jgi:acetyl esterase/lipase